MVHFCLNMNMIASLLIRPMFVSITFVWTLLFAVKWKMPNRDCSVVSKNESARSLLFDKGSFHSYGIVLKFANFSSVEPKSKGQPKNSEVWVFS